MANTTTTALVATGLSPTTTTTTTNMAILAAAMAATMIVLLLQTKKHPMPPGPIRWPIIGSLIQVLSSKPRYKYILQAAEGKDITFIRIAGYKVVVVNCPVIAREFLRRNDLSFSSRPLSMASGYYSRGFLSVAITPMSDQWRKMRRIVAGDLISPGRVNRLVSLREVEADHLVRYVLKQCEQSSGGEGAVVDVRLALRYFCGCVVRRMLFGRRLFGGGGVYGGPGKEEVDHVEAAFAVDKLLYAFCVSDLVPWLGKMDLDGHRRTVEEAMKVIDKYHDPIIDERIQRMKRKEGERGKEEEEEDLLDVMIALKDEDGRPLLTADEIKAQAAELFFAAIDNPSNVAEWAIAELVNQPDLLHKAVAELDHVVGRHRLVQESDFSGLTFIKSVARESLRLHPVSAFNMPHHSTDDAVVAGYFIPKGTTVLLSRVGLGRNPKVWEDPLRFNPDRHLKNVELAEPDLRFISFSAGRRRCMGAPLGTVITYLMLARLLQAFEWSPAPGETAVDLSEGKASFFMAKPLKLFAKPRLPILEKL